MKRRPPTRVEASPLLPYFSGVRALRPELPTTATMLATAHARAAPAPAGWRVAVVVLRYFVAVLLARTSRA